MPCIRARLCHTCSFSSLHKVIHTNAPVALWRGLFCSFLIFIICFFWRPFSAFRFASERNWGWHWDGTSLLTGFSQSSKVLSPLCLYMNYNVLYVVIMFHWERSLITLLPLLLFLVCTCSYLFVITVHVCTCLYVFVRVCTAAHIYMDLELPCRKGLIERVVPNMVGLNLLLGCCAGCNLAPCSKDVTTKDIERSHLRIE